MFSVISLGRGWGGEKKEEGKEHMEGSSKSLLRQPCLWEEEMEDSEAQIARCSGGCPMR